MVTNSKKRMQNVSGTPHRISAGRAVLRLLASLRLKSVSALARLLKRSMFSED